MGKRRDPETYEVGFCKPPQETQFKKGQSGNPRGRAKGSKSLFTVFEKMLQQRVTVRRDSKVVRLSQLEVMMATLLREAMQGNLRAAELVIKLATALEARAKISTDAEQAPRHGVLVVPAELTVAEWMARYGPKFPDEVNWEADLETAAAAKGSDEGEPTEH
ncbi:MAG: DUF5681 domain-containing protein [Gammaproteobacteria bacterium]